MNQEEKERFMEFVYKVANIDGDFAEEEQEIINSYKNELGIENINETGNVDELIDYFANKADPLKRIVLFETIGLVNADDKVQEAEANLLSNIKKKFGLDAEIAEKIQNVAEKLQKVYDEIYDTLFD